MSINAAIQSAEDEVKTTVPVSIFRESDTPNPRGDKLKFEKVKDSRGRSIDGLWERNGRFYCQTRVPGKRGTRRIPLVDEHKRRVETVPQAKAALDKLLANKREGDLPGPSTTPPFNEYADGYIMWLKQTEAKSPLTIRKEESALRGWKRFFGTTRLNQITTAAIDTYVIERKENKACNRTINLDVVALKHLLRFAKKQGYLKHKLATDAWEPLKHVTPKRGLLPDNAVDRLCAAALAQEEGAENGEIKPIPKYAYGPMVADLIKLWAYSGARRQAGLSARWSLVDWKNRQISFDTKFDKRVVVDFNDKLEAHLKDMWARRDTNSDWLFPSPRPGDVTPHLTTPQKTLRAIAKDARLPEFRPHDLRHWFISWCIMSDVPALTVAKWCGHADGGVLIGKVYGHLSNEHAQAAAQTISFGFTPRQPARTQEPTFASVLALVEMVKQGRDITKLTLADLLAVSQSKPISQAEERNEPNP